MWKSVFIDLVVRVAFHAYLKEALAAKNLTEWNTYFSSLPLFYSDVK